MFWFLRRRCVSGAGCITQLPEALLKGQATPETLFEWIISERTRDRIVKSPAEQWRDYVARGESFSPELAAALASSARR